MSLYRKAVEFIRGKKIEPAERQSSKLLLLLGLHACKARENVFRVRIDDLGAWIDPDHPATERLNAPVGFDQVLGEIEAEGGQIELLTYQGRVIFSREGDIIIISVIDRRQTG